MTLAGFSCLLPHGRFNPFTFVKNKMKTVNTQNKPNNNRVFFHHGIGAGTSLTTSTG